MIYETSPWAVAVFMAVVAFILWMAYFFARRTRTAASYFAASGTIHWAVNGIAFAGDYLSAASFLGICGMIAFFGYDGFLYSIGFLAGWLVALFVVAEPLKRMGKYTFMDALDAKFNAKSIQLTAAISTLVVSIFYLIPQMVGAGVLVTPLLGLPHHWGVIIVGTLVIIIVATAGMTSTTYVQFVKGGMLIAFSVTIVVAVMSRGLSTAPEHSDGTQYRQFTELPFTIARGVDLVLEDSLYEVPQDWGTSALYGAPDAQVRFVELVKDGVAAIWRLNEERGVLEETLFLTTLPDGQVLYNGAPREEGRFSQVGHMSEIIVNGQSVQETGDLDPITYLATVLKGTVVTWPVERITDGDLRLAIYYQKPVSGREILRPGVRFKVGTSLWENVNFISLMLALFLGTAALPHILIRYYTVPSPACARKSTIVAIAAIGFFYVLTLFMGLGAMTGGVLDVSDSNMSAPLLARSFGITLFSLVSALAFTTVLGTVSGLIVASSGAVAHDIIDRFLGLNLSDHASVRAGKISAIVVGIIAILLGIKYQGMNVGYLVGWAFAVAASANLPAIVMLLFWKRTTATGISASICVGIVAAVGLILLSPEMYQELYGLDPALAPVPISNPAIFSVPLSFLTLVVVSLLTQKKPAPVPAPREEPVTAPEVLAAEHHAEMMERLSKLSFEELAELIQEMREENEALRRRLDELEK